MRVFQNYRELNSAIENGSFRFLESFGPAGFVCSVCRQTVAFPLSGNGGTGYALQRDIDAMSCYPCADDSHRADMRSAQRTAGYLSSDGQRFTTWTGGILGTVERESVGARGWGGSQLTSVRVRAFDGSEWFGRGAGRGMFLKLKRCKV